MESVNDPPVSQNIFDRKGSRGPSDFDVRHNFVANVVYDLPGRGRLLGGWQASGVANAHSGLPFTPVLDFDNADLQSLVIPERPNLIGNPNAGVCPNGAAVGTVSCWFNPSAFAVPPAGQFGNAGRNILRGPAFAQFDASLHKDFRVTERRKITVGVEAYNLFNHPNFGVPSNTQSPLSLGGNGDAVFKDAAGNFAANAGQILTTVGTGRQIQLPAVYLLKGAGESGRALQSLRMVSASFSPATRMLNGSRFRVRVGANPRWRGIHALPRPAARQPHAPSGSGS